LKDSIELITIEDWYVAVWNDTRAAQHKCTCVEVSYRASALPFNREIDLIDRITRGLRQVMPEDFQASIVEIPSALVEGLVELEPDSYARLLKDPEVNVPLEDWHETQSVDHLRRATGKFVRLVDDKVHLQDTSMLSTKILPQVRLVAEKLNAKSGAGVGAGVGAAVALITKFTGGPEIELKGGAEDGGIIGGAAGLVTGNVLKRAIPSLQQYSQDKSWERIVQSIITYAQKGRSRVQAT